MSKQTILDQIRISRDEFLQEECARLEDATADVTIRIERLALLIRQYEQCSDKLFDYVETHGAPNVDWLRALMREFWE